MRLLQYFLFLFSFCVSTLAYGQAPNILWGGGIGGNGLDRGNAVVADDAGNSYVCGSFSGTITVGSTTLASKGGSDMYIIKYDPNGNILWAKAYGSAGEDEAKSIAIDNSGNIFIAGSIGGTVNFDGKQVPFSQATDLFVASFNSNGQNLSAFAAGGTGVDAANSITIDTNNNIYLSGYFSNSVNFNFNNTGSPIQALGKTDAFVAKYTNAGVLVWAKNIGENNGGTIGNSITVSPDGNVYIAGSVDLDASLSPLTYFTKPAANNGSDIFAAGYDKDGNFQWAFNFGNTAVDAATGIYAGSDNSIYLTGRFSSTVDFDPSAATNALTSTGINDGFIAKFDRNGAYAWAKDIGGDSQSQTFLNDLKLDQNNNLYITGGFRGTVDFDPAGSTANGVSIGTGLDIFTAKYDANGNYSWHTLLNGDGFNDEGKGLFVNDGKIHLAASFGSLNGTTPSDLYLDAAKCKSVKSNNRLDGFVAVYTSEQTSATDILSFTLPQQIEPAVINSSNHTVTIKVQPGTDVSKLTPTIIVPNCSTINPASGATRDFTNPAVYRVTDPRTPNTFADWTVTVISGPVCGTVAIKVDNITTTTPNDIFSCEGQNLTLSSTLTASGIVTPVYKWQFSVSNTSWTTIGTNAATLALNNVTNANTGYYKLTVSGSLPDNTSCSIESQVIKITVSVKPVIAADNNKVTLCPGESTTIRVSNGAQGRRYRWFKDGGSIEIPNSPDFITVTEPGTYTVRIENDGCSLVSNPVEVISVPLATAAFTYSIDCLTPATVKFTNGSSITDGSTLSYSWNFGDGTPLGTDVNPTHTYTSGGTKKVILTVTSSNGCTPQIYSLDLVITGSNNLQAKILSTLGPYCVGNEILFNDASTTDFGTASYRQWKVNNVVQSETGAQLKLNPTANGDYTISLSVGYTAACGAVSTTSTTFSVKPNAIAAFSTTINCTTPATVAFTNSSSIDDGSALTYTWNFGDGTPPFTTTNTATPTHTYTTPGTKTISLSVAASNGSGCAPSVITHDVAILGSNNLQAAIVIENASADYCMGNEVVFRDASTRDFGTINYRKWTVNGVDQTETGELLRLTPSQSGNYKVDLTVGFSSACPVSSSTTIQVKPNPVALFTTTIDCPTPATVAFDNQSSIADNSPLTYSWDFGDGNTLVTTDRTIPVHTYTSAGTKTIKLSVSGTNSSGCAPAVITHDVTIVGSNNLQAVVAIDNPLTTYCTGNEIVLRDASTRDFGTINYRVWTVNGNVQTETGEILRLTPSQSGTYTVELAVGYTSACFVSATTTIQVNPNPTALFTTTINCSTPATVAFDNQSSIPDNSSLTYSWDFGDGTTLVTTDRNPPAHTYSSIGEKTISLIVTADNSQCNSAKYEQKVTISGSNNITPQIMPLSTQPYCVEGALSFKDDSKTDFGTLNYRKWEINGVEQSEKGDVLTFTPTTSQAYVVRLTVGFSAACPATPVDYSFTVNAKPSVTLAPFNSVCQNDADFALTGGLPANGNGGVGYYTIDGGTEQVTVFSPQQAGAGTHTIKYTFVNSTGCESSAEQTITVGSMPQIVCKNYTALAGVDLQLKVEVQGTGDFTYSWSPSTGLSDPTIADPVLTPTTNTQYTVTVANGNCTSSCVINITVLPKMEIPNVFTPNGDGMNDNWVIEGIEDYPYMEVYIYDRYGSKLYYTKGYNKPWDGVLNGKNLPAGTYYYVFKPNQDQLAPVSGAVTIMY